MTTDELKELLGKVTPGEWRVLVDESAAQVTGYPIIEADDYVIVGLEGMYGVIEQDFTNATLIALAPHLARKVIAAEKLVEAANRLDDEYCGQMYGPALCSIESLRVALTEYEATK